MADLDVGSPEPFKINVPESALDDLKSRLQNTRWPEKEPVDNWSQGTPLSYMQSMADYWLNTYDWRECERELNSFGSYKIEIDGLGIHFLHVKSPHNHARPLLLTHGWPGSLVEFFDIIPRLTEPEKHGGNAEDAFHLVLPALPGFGFSDKPNRTGWTVEHIANVWAALMARLGYSSYLAQGGDWGAFVTTALGKQHPDACKAIHINLIVAEVPESVKTAPTKAEMRALKAAGFHQSEGSAYAMIQATKPQSLGYGLTDSPIGQAAWILEKFYGWTNEDGEAQGVASRKRLIDNVMMYWLTASATSSARIYRESYRQIDRSVVETPVGATVFPREIIAPSRRWAESRFKSLIYWNEAQKGGHFAALEQPDLLAQEIWACFKQK